MVSAEPATMPMGKPPPSNLSVTGQLWFDLEHPLYATLADTKTSQHFVKDQNNILFCAELLYAP